MCADLEESVARAVSALCADCQFEDALRLEVCVPACVVRVRVCECVVCVHALCACMRCVRACVVCGHALCACMRCVRACVVCVHALCAGMCVCVH